MTISSLLLTACTATLLGSFGVVQSPQEEEVHVFEIPTEGGSELGELVFLQVRPEAGQDAESHKKAVQDAIAAFQVQRDQQDAQTGTWSTDPGDAEDAERGYLGIRFQPDGNVMVIAELMAGSGAAEAGFQVGDRITRIGEHRFGSEDFEEHVSALRAGQVVEVRAERGDQVLEVPVTLRTLAEVRGEAAQSMGGRLVPGGKADAQPKRDDLAMEWLARAQSGAESTDSSGAGDAERGYLGIRFQPNGNVMVIAELMGGSGAAEAGLQVGDRITRIGEHRFGSEDFDEHVSALRAGQVVEVRAERGEQVLEVPVTLRTLAEVGGEVAQPVPGRSLPGGEKSVPSKLDGLLREWSAGAQPGDQSKKPAEEGEKADGRRGQGAAPNQTAKPRVRMRRKARDTQPRDYTVEPNTEVTEDVFVGPDSQKYTFEASEGEGVTKYYVVGPDSQKYTLELNEDEEVTKDFFLKSNQDQPGQRRIRIVTKAKQSGSGSQSASATDPMQALAKELASLRKELVALRKELNAMRKERAQPQAQQKAKRKTKQKSSDKQRK